MTDAVARFCFASGRLTWAGGETKLRLTEGTLLGVLGRYSGQIVSYDSLIRQLWPSAADEPRGEPRRVLQVHAYWLRRKIAAAGLAIGCEYNRGLFLIGRIEIDWTVH